MPSNRFSELSRGYLSTYLHSFSPKIAFSLRKQAEQEANLESSKNHKFGNNGTPTGGSSSVLSRPNLERNTWSFVDISELIFSKNSNLADSAKLMLPVGGCLRLGLR